MNFLITKEDKTKFLLINVSENQKDTLLKTLERFTVKEISDKEAAELCCCTKMTATDITAPPMYGDVFLPNDYEKPTNFEKHRTTKG